MSDAIKNYGIIRGGNPRKFAIGDEVFSVVKLPGKVQFEFNHWRLQQELPKEPEEPEEGVDYRTDYRSVDDLITDLAILTLNSARTEEQKSRFTITDEWLLENVSGDMIEDLVTDVMQPFLDHLTEKEENQKLKQAQTMSALLDPVLRGIVQEEMSKLQKKPLNNSSKSSSTPSQRPDGQLNTV